MSTDLRQKLIDAKLSGQRWNEGQVWQYTFRSNETAADHALAVFVEHLRERAVVVNAEADGRPYEDSHWLRDEADFLTDLADSITTPKGADRG